MPQSATVAAWGGLAERQLILNCDRTNRHLQKAANKIVPADPFLAFVMTVDEPHSLV